MSQQRKGCSSCETEFESGAKTCKECKRGKDEYMESVDYQTSRIQRLKRDGNQYFEQGQLEMALVKYTEGISLGGENKVLFLNRSLVFTKKGQFQEAVEDCTEVIESNEKTLHLKALLRRANAFKHLKNLLKARADIQAALKIQPNDQDAQKLQKDIDQEIEEEEIAKSESAQMRQFKNESHMVLEQYMQGDIDLLPVLQCMRAFPMKCRQLFFTSRCCKLLLSQVTCPQALNDEENFHVCLPALVLQIYMEDSREYQQDFVNSNGIEIVMKKIRWLFQQTKKLQSGIYDAVQDYLEVLMIFQIKANFLYPELFNCILHLKEPNLIETYLNICANECHSTSELKNLLAMDFTIVVNKLLPLFKRQEEAAACNLLTNLFTIDQCRLEAQKNQDLIAALMDSLSEQALNCLINLNLTDELTPIISQLVAKIDSGVNLDQCLELLSRSEFSDHYAFTHLIKQYPQALKVIIQAINNNQTIPSQPQQLLQLLESLEFIIKNSNDVHFINACTILMHILKNGPKITINNRAIPQYLYGILDPLMRVNGSKCVRETAQKLFTMLSSRLPKLSPFKSNMM